MATVVRVKVVGGVELGRQSAVVAIIISIDEAFRVNAIAPGPAAGLQNGWRLRTGGVFIRRNLGRPFQHRHHPNEGKTGTQTREGA